MHHCRGAAACFSSACEAFLNARSLLHYRLGAPPPSQDAPSTAATSHRLKAVFARAAALSSIGLLASDGGVDPRKIGFRSPLDWNRKDFRDVVGMELL